MLYELSIILQFYKHNSSPLEPILALISDVKNLHGLISLAQWEQIWRQGLALDHSDVNLSRILFWTIQGCPMLLFFDLHAVEFYAVRGCV